ncbi:hypothetical protein RGQ29_016347 [Quercus rubra]|uniref:Uncharacterized protein n=1 Tax=Quercus rubra TaxID=3512 RepID=A0AAN7FE75_QUERU|nr:hypothetical protein RGQ29_016347 [Quercus rubra]
MTTDKSWLLLKESQYCNYVATNENGKSLIVHVSCNHTGNGNSPQLQKDKLVGKDEDCSLVLATILLPSFRDVSLGYFHNLRSQFLEFGDGIFKICSTLGDTHPRSNGFDKTNISLPFITTAVDGPKNIDTTLMGQIFRIVFRFARQAFITC